MTIEQYMQRMTDGTGAVSSDYWYNGPRDRFVCDFVYGDGVHIGRYVTPGALSLLSEDTFDVRAASMDNWAYRYQDGVTVEPPHEISNDMSCWTDTTFWFRGDAVTETVYLPEGKTVDMLLSPVSYDLSPAALNIVTFDQTPKLGQVIIIQMKDAVSWAEELSKP